MKSVLHGAWITSTSHKLHWLIWHCTRLRPCPTRWFRDNRSSVLRNIDYCQSQPYTTRLNLEVSWPKTHAETTLTRKKQYKSMCTVYTIVAAQQNTTCMISHQIPCLVAITTDPMRSCNCNAWKRKQLNDCYAQHKHFPFTRNNYNHCFGTVAILWSVTRMLFAWHWPILLRFWADCTLMSNELIFNWKVLSWEWTSGRWHSDQQYGKSPLEPRHLHLFLPVQSAEERSIAQTIKLSFF